MVSTDVNTEEVRLDSVELVFREQYMGRSEMWRMKKKLLDSVVYMSKKVELCNDALRCVVNEMWANVSLN